MLDPKQIVAIWRLHWVDRWSRRRIARHLKLSRETIRKYLFSPDHPPSPSQRVSKLDSYKPAVAELVQRDFTVKLGVIFQHLRSLGYRGGLTILRDYVRNVRRIGMKPSRLPISGSRQEAFDWM